MFKCFNCKKEVKENGYIGTKNRNHCPFCLFSQHLDENIPGDRKSKCKGKMIPIGLSFKKGKVDKYGKEKVGELMIIHKCEKCGDISKNRIASDDNPDEIMKIFESSKEKQISSIEILTEKDREEVKKQLFGK
jgi:hypothetical protein